MEIKKSNIFDVKIEIDEDIEITDADEIARRTFRFIIKNSLELAMDLLNGQEEEPDYEERFKKLTREIFETHLKALEKYAEEK